MCFSNYYRDEEFETFEDFYGEIPPWCPYRYENMNRSASPSMPPGPPPASAPSKPMGGMQHPTGGPGHPAGGPHFPMGGPQPMAVEPQTIRRCLYKYVYIWPRRGRGFWSWLTFVGRRSVSGYKWNGYRWVYFGMDLREIDSFECR